MSLAAATLRGASVGELASAAAGAGFDCIGVRLSGWDPEVPASRPAGLAQARALVDGLGLAVLDVEQVRLREGSRPEEFEYLFESAAVLGAACVLVYAADPDAGRLAASLHALEEIGAPYGARPVLEFMPSTAVRTLGEALSVLERADLRAPTLLIDTLHLARSRAGLDELDRLESALLPFIHLADAPAAPPDDLDGLRREATYDRLLPGEGGLPLADYLRRLPRVPVALEVPGGSGRDGRQRALAAAAATRALLETVDGPEGGS